MTVCPFCERDPFHYVDNGVGMEAVAVTCCESGDMFFRGMRPEPETVTLSWEDFAQIGTKLAALRIERDRLREYIENLDGKYVCIKHEDGFIDDGYIVAADVLEPEHAA